MNIEDRTEYCEWKAVDMGMFGCNDYVWITSCGKEYDVDKVIKGNYCPNCGKKIK